MSNGPLDHHAAATDEDFVAQLQSRLGLVDEAAAVSTLGDWLSIYEAGPVALAHARRLPKPHRHAA